MLALASSALAQQTSKATLETNETVFAVLAAMNQCGYDDGLADPIRAQVRAEMQQNVNASEAAQAVTKKLCEFYNDRKQADPGRNLAQYISLALVLSEGPEFHLTVPEKAVPPDAANVQEVVPLLRDFLRDAKLHDIWVKHQPQYEALLAYVHPQLAEMINQTDLYLRNPVSGYGGRRFAIYVEPMGAIGQVNARNYGVDYLMVISPERGLVPLDRIRHTYLHYVLDPQTMKRPMAIKRTEALLPAVRSAPMDESFKSDASLLVTESLIRAIEARLLPGGKKADAQREAMVQHDMAQGFVLTHYFYGQLLEFEKGSASMDVAYGDMLAELHVESEKKRAEQTDFATTPEPSLEVARASAPHQTVLDQAEDRLIAKDADGARKLAQQAIDQKSDDPVRANFILARAAVMSGDMEGAQDHFLRTLQMARDPRTIAWSHIYLGRIFDIQEKREIAVAHYKAALDAGDKADDTKTAAEKGLAAPYAVPKTTP